ncbi:MAG: branched-chain amino acid ABC transporter substrate-binding protein [Chloroflexi bacterium]|nr:branched-chain amino acid ABC transporter substrate-binding protein [Chloroflexota bacterium]
MRGAPLALARLSSLSAAATLFLAACGGSPAQPTAAPAAPATTAPAKPAAAPSAAVAASPSAAASASPVAKPAASPAASPSVAAAPSPSAAVVSALTGTIKVVSSLPRTGASKGQTDTMVNAFRMALAEHQNKVGGATLTYEDMDDATAAKGAWDGPTEASNANKALNDPDVMVYIGTFNSGAAKVSIPILCAANLGMISPANTYPGLTKQTQYNAPNEPDVYYAGCKRNYTRVPATDDLQGAVGAVYAKQIGVTKVYILHDSDLYGQGISEVFAATAKKIGGLDIVGGPEGMDPQASDYRALAQKVRQSGADLVYWGGVTDHNAGKLWQDLRSTLGANVKLMGPDGIGDAAFVDAAGSAADGTYGSFPGVPGSKLTGKGAEWYQRYKQQFQGEPDPYAAYGYEAMNVAIASIEKANIKDRAAIRDAIFSTRNYDGVLGTWSFTETGDTTARTMSVRQVKGTQWDDSTVTIVQAPQ